MLSWGQEFKFSKYIRRLDFIDVKPSSSFKKQMKLKYSRIDYEILKQQPQYMSF